MANMLLCMRTTIQIDDHLFAELKKTAADTGRTMSATIQDALREALYRPREAKRLPAELPVFHGTGLMPGVDLNDAAALLELMDEHNGAA